MSAAADLSAARRRYDIATRAWREQEHSGGIRRLDPDIPAESDEIAKGCRWKAETAAGRMALGMFQKAKAELDHWAAVDARERGRTDCLTCPGQEPMGVAPADDVGPMPDPRLPPERDDDAGAWT